jgi:hypothetical protein
MILGQKQIFDPKYISKVTLALITSVPDPDPEQAKIGRKTLIPTVL